MSGTRLARAAPDRAGIDPRGLHDFLDAVGADGLDLHGFMLFRHGAVVAEGFWHPYAADIPHALHSATKSLTAAAVGLAWDDGLIRLEDAVVEFFPGHLPERISENLAAMTVRDLLTMRTGHASGISGGAWRGLRESWVRAFLREEVGTRPGTDFIYSSASSYMLSAIVTKVTGQTTHDFLAARLFQPLGVAGARWDLSPEGFSTGGNGLTCRLEDLLKFGVLHLQRGMWDGAQILSQHWVDEATRNQVDHAWLGALDGQRYSGAEAAERRKGYGYHWWMTEDSGYRASGVFGQHCIVLPAQGAVIAVTAGLALRDKRLLDRIWRHLLPAMTTVPGGGDGLADRLRGLAKTPPQGAAHASLAASVSGARWDMEPNDDGIVAITLHFDAEVCRFELQDCRSLHTVVAGLGSDVAGETTMTGDKLHHAYQPPSLRVLAHGVWPAPDRFEMTWRFVETAFTDQVTCRFFGEKIWFERSVNANAGPTERPTIVGRRTVRVPIP